MVLTPAEARKYLHIGKTLMYSAIKRGIIDHVRIGKKILIPKAALDKFLDAKPNASQPQNHVV